MNQTAKIFFILICSAFLTGNFYKFSFLSPDIHISLLDVVIALIIIYGFLFHRSKIIFSLRHHIISQKYFYLFLLAGLPGLIYSFFHFGHTVLLVGTLYWLRLLVYFSLAPFLLQIFSTNNLQKTLMATGAVLAVTCMIQYIFFPDVRGLAISDWDPHYFRVVGSLLDPGFTAIIITFFVIHYFLSGQKLYGWFFYLLLALTYSRSAFLALLISSAYVSISRKSPKIFFTSFLIILLTIFVLPRAPGGEGVKLERTSSITARIINWKNSFQIFASRPVFGTGFNVYRYVQAEAGFLDKNSDWLRSHAGAGADSSLLFVLATTGVVGFVFYLLAIRNLWHQFSGDLASRAFFVALMVHSLFLNSLFYTYVLFLLGSQIGLSRHKSTLS